MSTRRTIFDDDSRFRRLGTPVTVTLVFHWCFCWAFSGRFDWWWGWFDRLQAQIAGCGAGPHCRGASAAGALVRAAGADDSEGTEEDSPARRPFAARCRGSLSCIAERDPCVHPPVPRHRPRRYHVPEPLHHGCALQSRDRPARTRRTRASASLAGVARARRSDERGRMSGGVNV